MLEIEWTTSFKRDFKKFKHNHDVLEDFQEVLDKLVRCQPLAERHRDHNLTGNWSDHRECHVRNDLLLVYRTDESNLILVRFNTHSEIFG
ncbi:MAG: type II toxin-antitoxin system YafQ family toxin [Verrucomicrobia bacterium]|nr:type II toxin-antitoxin system YafQ family toxin [Verrucomicrobiota bacterium]MBS0636066.1 type II toxin-antitoxin system YafQ family toxin [Verrucomicrobiota bacterium]